MKFPFIIVATALLIIAACKTPYKATDRTQAATDSTAATTDTTTAIKQAPSAMDSSMVQRDTGAATIDSTNRSLPDSSKIATATDSLGMKKGIDSAVSKTDSAMNKPQPDPGRVQPADSTHMQAGKDSSAKSVQAPATLETAFTKQYPGAVNVVWSNYDSLAAVPIDMRLTGWKKMDADDYMVTFDFKDQNYYAWYDSDGKWVGSAYTLSDYSKLPAAVNKAVNNAIKTRYSDYNVTKVNRELRAGNKSAYEVELSKDDSKVRMLVNADGKITQIFKYSADKSK